jgi:hypothetical protein
MTIEDLIIKAKSIDCWNTININPFYEKTKILSQILDEIEKIIPHERKHAKELLMIVENIIYNYQYEASYNRTIEYEAGKFVFQLLPKLVGLGEIVFEGKELLPFLKEKLWITNDEPARSTLYKRIDELEKNG